MTSPGWNTGMAPVEVLASLPPLLLLLLLLRLRDGSRAASVATAKTCSTAAATWSMLPFSPLAEETTARVKASTEALAERLACAATCSPLRSVACLASTC